MSSKIDLSSQLAPAAFAEGSKPRGYTMRIMQENTYRILIIRYGSHPAADCLHHQAANITADENESVTSRANPANCIAIHDGNARQTEVDGGGHESRRQRQADEIDEKVVSGEGIAVQ